MEVKYCPSVSCCLLWGRVEMGACCAGPISISLKKAGQSLPFFHFSCEEKNKHPENE